MLMVLMTPSDLQGGGKLVKLSVTMTTCTDKMSTAATLLSPFVYSLTATFSKYVVNNYAYFVTRLAYLAILVQNPKRERYRMNNNAFITGFHVLTPFSLW